MKTFHRMYSLYLREHIVHLSRKLSGSRLVEAMKEEGFHVTRSGVYYVLKKWNRSRTIFDYPRSGQPSCLSELAHSKVNRWLGGYVAHVGACNACLILHTGVASTLEHSSTLFLEACQQHGLLGSRVLD